MTGKNKSELVKQIEAYGLKSKLADLAQREQARQPFRHLPKQFSKGILIGNIAIVPKKHTGTRYVYVIADMFDIQSAKRMIREAQKNKDEQMEDVYWDRLDVANRLADEYKDKIQQIFSDTFGT
jgi:hypothetical protein